MQSVPLGNHVANAIEAFKILYPHSSVLQILRSDSYLSVDNPDDMLLCGSDRRLVCESAEKEYARREIMDKISKDSQRFLALFVDPPQDAEEPIHSSSGIARRSSAILYARTKWGWSVNKCTDCLKRLSDAYTDIEELA